MNTETCAWCGEEIRDTDERVIVDPHDNHTNPSHLHYRCGTEWSGFIDQARTLAKRGKSHRLLRAPLENGYDIDTVYPEHP